MIHADIILLFMTMLYLFLQNGMTALMGACEGGHLSVVKELVENRGADIDAKDNVRYYIQIRFMMDRWIDVNFPTHL